MGDDGRETLCAVRFDDEICSLFPEMLFPHIPESGTIRTVRIVKYTHRNDE
jgi:hypothetical protein